MKSDMEVLHEYIEEYDEEFFNSLSYVEKTLFLCQLRDTLSFSLYLLGYRILEFCHIFVECIRW